MGIQIQGNAGVVAEVDGTTFRSVRTTVRPPEYGSLGMYRLGATSGIMAASLAAGSELFQFRWPDASRLALVYRVTISIGSAVAAGAASTLSVRLTLARGWTVAGSGGTRIDLSGNNCKLRSSMGTSLVNDAGISTTTGLTPGTKTLDVSDFGNISYGVGNAATTTETDKTLVPYSPLYSAEDISGHPIVLAENEGLVIRSGIVHPNTMTWAFSISILWAEVNSF